MLVPSPKACPEITYGLYCSFGVWASIYFLIDGLQLTGASDLSSVHQTARKRNSLPLNATPEITEYDPSLLFWIDWPSARAVQFSKIRGEMELDEPRVFSPALNLKLQEARPSATARSARLFPACSCGNPLSRCDYVSGQ